MRPTTVMLKDYPDHHDAELVIKLYELRREPTMRASRAAIAKSFWPKTLDELMAVTKTEHELNAAFRQTGSYWEMAYGMAKHGIIHADFMLESNGEGLLLLARVEPFLEEYRAAANSPRAFRNAEWIAANSELGQELMLRFRARVEKMVGPRK